MKDLSGEVLAEAVELSKTVFSERSEDFGESYNGELDSYIMVEDLINRIEDGLITRGGDFPYMGELPDFSDFGYESESWATVFYSLTPDSSYGDFADVSGFSPSHISSVLSDLEEEGLVSTVEFDEGKKYFYGENAFPYLMILSEAEFILEEQDSDLNSEPSQYSELVNDSDSNQQSPDTVEDEEEGDGGEKSLQEIMVDVAEDDEDLMTTFEQEDDRGVNSRDHTDTETEDTSNPGDDEYYEGW